MAGKVVISIFTLLTVVAQARSLDGFQGKIHNHTPADSTAVEITISFSQWKRDLLGYKKPLKSGTVPVTQASNGEFTVDSTDLGWRYHHTVRVRLEAKTNLVKDGYPETVRFIELEDDEIKKLPTLLKDISVLYSAPQDLPISLSSGLSAKEWIETQAIETLVERQIIIADAEASSPLYLEDRLYPAFSEGQLPARLLFVLGAPGATPQITTKLKIINKALNVKPLASGQATGTFQSALPLPSFLIDDLSLPQLDRTLSDEYQVVLSISSKDYQKHFMFDGELALHCADNGLVTGQIQVNPRGGNNPQFSLAAPLTGVCRNGKANIAFDLSASPLGDLGRVEASILGVVYRNQNKSLRGTDFSIVNENTPYTHVKLVSPNYEGRMEVK